MRNDLTASDRPRLANAPIGRGRSRRRRTLRSGLVFLPLALVLIAPGATALAAQATTNYGQTTPPPQKTETTPAPKTGTPPASKTETTPAPKQEAGPTQTSSTPAHETSPAMKHNGPTATAAHAKTLPFTGLDLRWAILGGVLLVGVGMSIVVVQRGRHGIGR